MPLRRAVLAVLVSVVLLPASLHAQGDRASISGQVTDSSGAVLPGVTVEASSPALIHMAMFMSTPTA